MGDEPDFIVLRRHPDLPAEFRLPDGDDGRWLDRSRIPVRLPPPAPHITPAGPGAVAVPTGRFEVRDDGAVAEIWEFQP